MKKVIKSKIFLVIITTIVVASVSIYATNAYNATDVVYNASDGTSMTVNDALNELYENNNKQIYLNGLVAYYNPVSGEKCKVSEAVSTTGTKTGCMKWYIYKDDGKNYTMILDHNTTATLVWNTDDVNVSYESSNIKLEVDKLVSESGWVDTPRLITAEEVAQITGYPSWTNTGDWFCLDTNQSDNTTWCAKSQGTSKYAWLFDYTNGCTSYGCNTEDNKSYSGYYIWGYWTSTAWGTAGSGNHLWHVFRCGGLHVRNASMTDNGIRPVITIPKSRLS